MIFFFRTKVLSKYEVAYFHCPKCGLLQTETPYWLDEAYDDAITILDTGIVSRNVSISKMLTLLLLYLCGRNGRYLDSAGGYGLLTRIMRDIGFNFYWKDVHCKNIFARGFEAKPFIGRYKAVTAFEVLEHLMHPLEFIQENLSFAQTDTFIFSTLLYYGDAPGPNQWWYYAHEAGQHISFYTRKTLSMMAQRLSMNLFSQGAIHIFSKRRLSKMPLAVITSPFGRVMGELIIPVFLKSKMMTDHEDLKHMQNRQQ